MADYTDEEILIFKDADDISFNEIDANSAYKSNLLIEDNNFKSLNGYLSKLKAYVKYVEGLINIDSIINQIMAKYQSSKNVLMIDMTLAINGISNQLVNGINYRIERTSQYIIEVTNLNTNTWNTDNLIIQVKTSDGIIVYPRVATVANKIVINFIDGTMDGFSSGYRLYFI